MSIGDEPLTAEKFVSEWIPTHGLRSLSGLELRQRGLLLDDLVQEVYLRAVRGHFDEPIEKPEQLVRSIGRQVHMDYLRGEVRWDRKLHLAKLLSRREVSIPAEVETIWRHEEIRTVVEEMLAAYPGKPAYCTWLILILGGYRPAAMKLLEQDGCLSPCNEQIEVKIKHVRSNAARFFAAIREDGRAAGRWKEAVSNILAIPRWTTEKSSAPIVSVGGKSFSKNLLMLALIIGASIVTHVVTKRVCIMLATQAPHVSPAGPLSVRKIGLSALRPNALMIRMEGAFQPGMLLVLCEAPGGIQKGLVQVENVDNSISKPDGTDREVVTYCGDGFCSPNEMYTCAQDCGVPSFGMSVVVMKDPIFVLKPGMGYMLFLYDKDHNLITFDKFTNSRHLYDHVIGYDLLPPR
jgi:hypothetical protein